ncbi:V-type ATPse C subunit family protein [Colletotrichum tofieldiae]|nr:V-type ATPse C subunit family protein [Colletotrichum tofieldiae]
MPNLWQDDQPKSSRGSKLQTAISFHFSTYGESTTKVNCTLPLANTIFQNGLQSTLLASRWRRSGPRTALELAHVTEKQSQDVAFPVDPDHCPRKILTGLGNIIRQVEVDGKETPASAELEKAVNELYARRTNEGHEFPPGP